jgi:hypothetical protein
MYSVTIKAHYVGHAVRAHPHRELVVEAHLPREDALSQAAQLGEPLADIDCDNIGRHNKVYVCAPEHMVCYPHALTPLELAEVSRQCC